MIKVFSGAALLSQLWLAGNCPEYLASLLVPAWRARPRLLGCLGPRTLETWRGFLHTSAKLLEIHNSGADFGHNIQWKIHKIKINKKLILKRRYKRTLYSDPFIFVACVNSKVTVFWVRSGRKRIRILVPWDHTGCKTSNTRNSISRTDIHSILMIMKWWYPLIVAYFWL